MNLGKRSASQRHRLAWVGAFVLAGWIEPATAHAQLLFEHHQGGPSEYTESGINHAAEFQVTVPTRITGVTGWIDGGSGIYGYDPRTGEDGSGVAISISYTPFGGAVSVFSPSGPKDYFTIVHPNPLPLPPPGVLTTPGRWTGVGGLKWDLEPGVYDVNLLGAGMPIAYGFNGPFGKVADVDAFFNAGFDRSEPWDSLPFGVRIYGRPLSAVPETATFGAVGALLLFGALLLRRRHVALE